MRSTRLTARLILLFAAVALLFPARAHAYLDPNTGSYFFQIAIAGLLGGAYTLKVYWRRVVGALRAPFRKGSSDETDGR